MSGMITGLPPKLSTLSSVIDSHLSAVYTFPMTSQTVTIHLPEHLWQQFQEAAREDDQPLEHMLLQAIQGNKPPSLTAVPAQTCSELRPLKRMSDAQLWQIAESRISAEVQTRLEWLLDKNQARIITATEQQELAQLSEEADRLTVKKAFAYALLRWRGYPIVFCS